MVSSIPNPALDAFIDRVAPELLFGEVLVRRISEEFDLRNIWDRETTSLRMVSVAELRDIAQFTATKQFRPLKSAPTLQHGWRFVARNSSELDAALQCLYPGAVADWFAALQPDAPVTHYRDFTARQTGMYRVTTMLSDDQVALVARACCRKEFCLKLRLWTVEGLAADAAAEKSLIPCLEPCAVLLEFARMAARIEQQEKRGVSLAPAEIETCATALEQMVARPRADLREADFAAADNPRRAQLLLEKLKPVLAMKGEHEHK
jgi:hypothetical protein